MPSRRTCIDRHVGRSQSHKLTTKDTEASKSSEGICADDNFWIGKVSGYSFLLSGLETIGLSDVAGNWVSMTTVQMGVNEFGLLMILAVFVSVIVTRYVFNAIDKNE